MPNMFGRSIEGRVVDHIKYRNTVIIGEVVTAHINGTYDLKLSGENAIYPNIPTIFTNPDFVVNESVGIQLEYGNRESMKIIGKTQNIIQIVKNVITYNYV